ncbi:cytoskeleton-associated protein 2-like isoform X1 [Anser cygnoides]|uniref:cytoskeleton-associated protein 2-like isoform X1 n=1 Tax=Anser cygnoides TaxID=8845 RepID=UPI0034D31E6A
MGQGPAPGSGRGDERRRQLQEYLAATGKLKQPNTKPYLNDRINRLDPLLKPVSKPEHANRNKRDALPDVAKDAQRDGKLASKPTRLGGRAAPQKSSSASRGAAVVHPEQPGKSTKLSLGLVLGVNPSTQPRGRLPASASGSLNPGGTEETARGRPVPRAPSSLSEGLQEQLDCNKENFSAQAPTNLVQSRAFQSDGSSLGNRRALAHRQTSGTVSSTIQGPKDRINSCQAKETLIQDKFRKSLPSSKSASQKPSGKTRPLQPRQSLAVSTNLLHKKPAVKHEKMSTAGQPVGKPLGTLLGGSLQHCSRAPQAKRSPPKPPASSRPLGAANLGSTRSSSVKLVPGQRPAVKGGAERKDVKAPRGHTAASRARAAVGRPHSPKTRAAESRRERLNPELLQARGVHAGRVPKTQTAEDRRRQLEQWLASKGKSYKRPPMTLPQKKPERKKLPFWSAVKEEEKAEKPEQLHLDKINNLLTEYLKLIEEGVHSEEFSAILSHEPRAEKCAKFWICKVKLLARSGPFDVMELYEAAVCAGATPLQELREVVLDILKTAGQPPGGEKAEQPAPGEPTAPCLAERQHTESTPSMAGSSLPSLPVSSIKLQVTSVPRGRELPEGQELKFLTPVRRSLRIERAVSCYPVMLKDHDPVVSSLNEILDDDEEMQYFFRKNKALPEVAEVEVLKL